MEIIKVHYPVQASEEPSAQQAKTIAIGHFDGVHEGHQNVIRRCVEAAKASGQLAAVMTFYPHPKEVLGQGGHYVTCLTPLEDKVERFRKLGVDLVYVIQFDLEFSKVEPVEFVHNVLSRLHVKRVVVGFDFRFGAKGAGDAGMLRKLCEPGMKVEIVEPLMQGEVKVSSTLIRERLAAGQPDTVDQLMGRHYSLSGSVVRGEGRGRKLGFPTANIEPSGAYVVPKRGVYAIIAHVDGERIAGVLNIGVKPTFHDELPQAVLEAHLLDYDGDLYGKTIRIEFLRYLRGEKKFASVGELIEQIHADAQLARNICAASIN